MALLNFPFNPIRDRTQIVKDQDGGFEKIAKGLQADVDASISFNKKVTDIYFDQEKVKILMEDGDCYVAERCIVTVPAATLNGKGYSIAFHGPQSFTSSNLSTINPMEAGVYNKFFCKFNTPFWGHNAAAFLTTLRQVYS